MSYEVKVRHLTDSGDGFSVEAEINGEPIAHTFPKGRGFLKRGADGKPRYVNELIEMYEERHSSSPSIEEKIARNKVHENKTFKVGGENHNNAKKEEDTMNPEDVRTYLKENMAEGYLSDEEEVSIDNFVDEYERLLDVEENLQDIMQEVFGVD